MQIKKIVVGLGTTASIGDYENIRPSIEFTADLDGADDPVRVLMDLWRMAEEEIHLQVDDHREANGMPPQYYDGPRYQVAKSKKRRLIAVLPAEITLDSELSDFVRVYGVPRECRLDYAMAWMERAARESGYDEWLVESLDQIHELPALPPLYTPATSHRRMVATVIPTYLASRLPADFAPREVQRLEDAFEFLKLKYGHLAVVDCSDGDLSRLPDLPEPEQLLQEVFFDNDEEEYDDEEDYYEED